MFCKNCGKEIDEDARFCPECGTAQRKTESFKTQEDDVSDTKDTEEPAKVENSTQTNKENTADKQDDTIKRASDEIGKINPLCITSLVLTVLMFFFRYTIICYAALLFAILGFRAVKKNGERGLMLAIVCMAVSGVISLITIMEIVEYNRYMSASYGTIDALSQWLENLF